MIPKPVPRFLRHPFSLWLHFLLLVCLLALLHRDLPGVDLAVSDMFYHPLPPPTDPHEGWLLPKNHLSLSFWLHTFIVRCFVGLTITSLGLCVLSYVKPRLHEWRWPLLALFLSQLLIPCSVAILKQETFRYCPSQLARYGGPVPMAEVEGRQLPHLPRPTCWPAAHPAAGFALLALAFFPKFRLGGVVIGLASGIALGLIQLARGEHFLTHIVATFLIALFVQHLVFHLGLRIRSRPALIRDEMGLI